MSTYATTDLLLADLGDPTPSAPLRPILTRLTADNSWMISLPRPTADASGKAYYHILQDLWLGGALIQFSSLLAKVTRLHAGHFDDVADIERLIAGMEKAARSGWTGTGKGVDAILVTHYNSDHCHRETMERFGKGVTVLAVKDVVAVVEGWGHFETVVEVPDLEPGAAAWPGAVAAPAPDWLRVFRLPDRESIYPYIHHAVVISVGEEALLYVPHGLDVEKAEHAVKVAPEGMQWMAMLHSLDELGTGKATSRGVKGGLAIAEATKVKYWARTHDREQVYSGLLRWILWLKSWTLQEGVEEFERQGKKMERMPEYFEIENGGALVLAPPRG
ncbi:hypothetical protein ACHAQA_005760 [Verticillium albo-atrum]